MGEFNIQIPMVTVLCPSCGVIFAISERLQQAKQRDGDGVHCPSGHEIFWPSEREWEREQRQKTLPERQELILALHRAEQAEAKAAEVRTNASSGNGSNAPAALPEDPAPPTCDVVVVDSRLKCTKCGTTYKFRKAMVNHLHAHGMDRGVASEVIAMAVDAHLRPGAE